MGRTQTTPHLRGYATKIATGIAVRQWKNSTTLRISFGYQGVECRETLSLPATKPNIQYAERLRGEILNAIAKGTFNYGAYFPDSKRARLFGHVNANPLIGDLLHDFLQRAERTLQSSTVTSYHNVCHAHLFKTFGKLPIRSLTPPLLRKWLSGLSLTTKAVRNILTPLRAILNEAVNDDILMRNPLDRVVLSKLLNKNTRQSQYKPDPFNPLEIQAILDHADDHLRPLFQFAFFSGLRSSELIALRWEDIDWDNGVAHISRAIVYGQEKSTKTHAGLRTILLLPPALAALRAQKALTFLQNKHIFHSPYTQKPWTTHRHMARPHWHALLKKAGVRYRNLYQTRHTYASMLLSAGENMLWVSKQMGHRDTEMIIKTYGKWIPRTDAKTGYQTTHDWSQAIPDFMPAPF